jgi:N-acetyl-1-D-myo-inositol-2-amino-2-deoxy-alpha-D-glucopyranoside deacetylase
VIAVAHPDDELFHAGVLAHLSERGVRVTLVCATNGDAGRPHPSVGPIADLGARRAEELRLSCKRLGIEEPVLLGFHDSARKERFRRDDPQALANVDMLTVEAALRRVIARTKPQIVVTFELHGGYYHPDHVAISRAATATFFSSGSMGSEAPERLFYAGMLTDVFRTFAEVSRGRGIVDGLDPDIFGCAPEMIAVSFDARSYMERKLSVLTAHRSMFGITDDMLHNPPPPVAQMLSTFRPVMEREVFMLGGTRVPIARWPLSDFFEGLENVRFERPMMSAEGGRQ